LNSVQRARSVADEKKKREEDRIAVKPKSADNYVGLPKYVIAGASNPRPMDGRSTPHIGHGEAQFTLFEPNMEA